MKGQGGQGEGREGREGGKSVSYATNTTVCIGINCISLSSTTSHMFVRRLN